MPRKFKDHWWIVRDKYNVTEIALVRNGRLYFPEGVPYKKDEFELLVELNLEEIVKNAPR